MTTEKKSDVVTEVIDGRRSVYGNPADTFPRVAQIWSGILGTEVQAFHVPLLLMGYKLARTAECPEYGDNSDDIEGYLDTFREVMGDKLIDARSVDEFIKKREQGERKARAVEAQTVTRAQAHVRTLHTDPCWMWNQTWDSGKWPFTCVCRMQPTEVAAISASRTETEA